MRASSQTTRSTATTHSVRHGDMLGYIHRAWRLLTRSTSECSSLLDAKVKARHVLYVPFDFEIPHDLQARMQECDVSLQRLPKIITHIGDVSSADVPHQGLLYLPHPYVVPGGRFNEMYGWDSYFIIRGLLRDDHADLARGMIENFFFEIDHYGAILNANRTYYLSRSQPPFLTSMIRAYYDSHPDRGWLERAYGYAVRDYGLWTHDPHLAGDTGLSRYYDLGDGPVPEMGDDPHYYLQVADHILTNFPDDPNGYLDRASGAAPQFSVRVCAGKAACSAPEKIALSKDYYKGDRAMRESGFDVSFRFGPFSGSTHHFAPVCLNSLLYKAETDLEQFAGLLGRPAEAAEWRQRAQARREAVNKLLWNSEAGMFFDYDFVRGRQSDYRYASTFYPVWVGLATQEQAAAVRNNLKIFEQPGGIAMSDRASGEQWDLPYGWAPVQLITVEGLRRYGYANEADRVAGNFVETVRQNFLRDGTIREKYDVVTRSSRTSIRAGYKANVVGFGWTNGVVREFLHDLTKN